MFTVVNSIKENMKQSDNRDASKSPLSIDPQSTENKLAISSQIHNFFSVKDDFLKLQLVIFVITFIISIIVSLIAFIAIDSLFGLSIFVGSIAGIFYLRLLAKSIGNLGKTSSGVSKLQLLIPVCLFILASKFELIQIFPAIIGFFIYKPALIIYFSRS